MAGKRKIVEVGNSNHRRASHIAEPTSEGQSSKFAAMLKSLLGSSRRKAPLTSVCSSTRIERMKERRSEFATEVEFEIVASKDHWSELESASGRRGGDAMELDVSIASPVHMTNTETIESLRRQWPETLDFFSDFGDALKVGAKIAEGAQAEIFEAVHNGSGGHFVLKVFKEGSSVRDLQRQWPLGMLQRTHPRRYKPGHLTPILSGTVVMNGRFAFQMHRYWGDLRKFIDLRMQRNQQPLFSDSELKLNMRQIAVGMKSLHEDHIIHRDLKASNVLIRLYENYQDCWVADYECSLGVLGTGFWRAPEILLAMKNRNITSDTCTQKSDVYSYAMTCYEMITGHLPFEDLDRSDYDVVLRGDRPILPGTIEPWIKTLLGKCWRSNPLDRPTFEDIVECIDSNFDNRLYYRYAILNHIKT